MIDNNELGMYALAGNPPCASVQIGDFTLCRQSEGKIWIQRGDGEGGEFSENKLAEFIAKYYDENF